MSRKIVGIILPDTQEMNALFIADIGTLGPVVYIFFSREQGLDILENHADWSDDPSHRECIREIGSCGLPIHAERDYIIITKEVARTLCMALDYAGHDGQTIALSERRQPIVRVFAAVLKPEGGVLSLMERGIFHLYIFSSKPQGLVAIEAHRLRMDPADYAAYKQQIGSSVLSPTDSRPLVHVSGFAAETVAGGFERLLLVQMTRSRVRALS